METNKENLITITELKENIEKIEVLTDPNPILRQICEVIDNPKSPETKSLIDKMKNVLQQAGGIGLAANQIGENKRIFIVKTEEKRPFSIFINPEIIRTSNETVAMEEGCLSIPNKVGTVIRPERITLKAINEHGLERIVKAKELFARVVQHELDHLEGILFTDKAVPESIKIAEDKLEKEK